jgi:hypothetical protein
MTPQPYDKKCGACSPCFPKEPCQLPAGHPGEHYVKTVFHQHWFKLATDRSLTREAPGRRAKTIDSTDRKEENERS